MKNYSKWVIFLCWLVYTSSYLGRYSYIANLNAIIDYFNVSHAKAGLVTTFFFLAYGIFQFINGVFCKHYPKRITIFLALLVSSISNILLFFDIPFFIIKYLWLINGIAQSCIWPILMITLADNLSSKDLNKSVIIMGSTIAISTLFIYSISAIFALFEGFKYVFLLSFIIMSIVGVIWFIMFPKLNHPILKENTSNQRQPFSSKLIWTLIIFAMMAIINNFIKDGLTTWLPTFLKEKYHLSDSLSISLTIILPILGLFGTIFAVFLSKKSKSFVSLIGRMFFYSFICLLCVLAFLNTSLWMAILILFGLISLFMHGINNTLTDMAPLYMRDKMNSGMLAGLLDGCCYIGSTISSFGLGLIIDLYGWNQVCMILSIICFIPCVLSIIFSLTHKNQKLV